jgi:nucleotide-binding universal stress UspA family protein
MARVLVPFSDLASGERAVARIIARRRHPRLRIELLAIVDPLTPGKVEIFVSPERAREQARAAAEAWLAGLGAKLGAAGIKYQTDVAFGKLRDILKRARARQDIDEVVLGSAERDVLRGLRRRLVAQAMARPLPTIS